MKKRPAGLFWEGALPTDGAALKVRALYFVRRYRASPAVVIEAFRTFSFGTITQSAWVEAGYFTRADLEGFMTPRAAGVHTIDARPDPGGGSPARRFGKRDVAALLVALDQWLADGGTPRAVRRRLSRGTP